MIRCHLVITGKVQGVYYHAWFEREARSLRLDGWVRNRADSSVEAAIQGPAEAVEAMIARAREGPPASGVEDIVVKEMAGPVPAGFEIRPTA